MSLNDDFNTVVSKVFSKAHIRLIPTKSSEDYQLYSFCENLTPSILASLSSTLGKSTPTLSGFNLSVLSPDRKSTFSVSINTDKKTVRVNHVQASSTALLQVLNPANDPTQPQKHNSIYYAVSAIPTDKGGVILRHLARSVFADSEIRGNEDVVDAPIFYTLNGAYAEELKECASYIEKALNKQPIVGQIKQIRFESYSDQLGNIVADLQSPSLMELHSSVGSHLHIPDTNSFTPKVVLLRGVPTGMLQRGVGNKLYDLNKYISKNSINILFSSAKFHTLPLEEGRTINDVPGRKIPSKKHILDDVFTEHSSSDKWSEKVKVKFHTPPGLFEQSAEEIADYLKNNSSGMKQAMERLNFYINRAGSNLSSKDRARLNNAKRLLGA